MKQIPQNIQLKLDEKPEQQEIKIYLEKVRKDTKIKTATKIVEFVIKDHQKQSNEIQDLKIEILGLKQLLEEVGNE